MNKMGPVESYIFEPSQHPIDLTISIVSMNNVQDLQECLRSIYSAIDKVKYEIILVAYQYEAKNLDAIREEFPGLVIIQSHDIKGYSANHNLALRQARGQYVFILNDDTIVCSNIFLEMMRYLDEHRDVAAVCPTLLNPDGSVQLTTREPFTPTNFIKRLIKIGSYGDQKSHRNEDLFSEPQPLEVGTGAAFFVRNDVLKEISYLDEDYFLGPDDIDWSYRIRKLGWKLVLLSSASLIHKGGKTLSKNYSIVFPTVMAGSYTYFNRYYGNLVAYVLRFLSALISFLYMNGWIIMRLLSIRKDRAAVMIEAHLNNIRFSFNAKKSRDIFIILSNEHANTGPIPRISKEL